MSKDSGWRPRHRPGNSGPRKHATGSSHSQTGKYSLTLPLPLPLPPRLSLLLPIPCKPELNRRLVEEYKHSVSHDHQSHASDGLGGSAGADYGPQHDQEEDERPTHSCLDEIIIPSSPRPKARTLPIQTLTTPPWSPPSSPPSSPSLTSSSSSDRDEPRRGRPLARTRSYQQLPDCFTKSRDPLLWYDEPPNSKHELQRHRSSGALDSLYSRHATPPPSDISMLPKKYDSDRWSRGSYDDIASLREKRKRDEIWREFFDPLGFSRETSSNDSSFLEGSGSVWGSSGLPSIPTWKRVDDDDDDDDDAGVDELIDEEEYLQPSCLFHSDEDRGFTTSHEGSETVRLPSISEWYKRVKEYEEEEDELVDEPSESSTYQRTSSVHCPRAQESQKPPPSKKLSPESERKLQKLLHSLSLAKRGLKPLGYVASPLGPDWKKPQ